MRTAHAGGMTDLLIAGQITPVNVALHDACRRGGVPARLLPLDIAARRAGVDDAVLARVDVRPGLDGIEPGLELLADLERRGVRVLNTSACLTATHDKLRTAATLAAAGVPHPRTVPVAAREPLPDLDFAPPYVVKPRFGSWGQGVVLSGSRRSLERTLSRLHGLRWFERGGAVVQQYVPNDGVDLRLVVAGHAVVGAIMRRAAPGEWRTNITLGGSREPATPSLQSVALAMAAAAAVDGDLIGVDILPTPDGPVVLEINGCVDFTAEYGTPGRDVFVDAALSLADRANARTAALAAFES
jgi:RimK family alpha-L-glutamate ligase